MGFPSLYFIFLEDADFPAQTESKTCVNAVDLSAIISKFCLYSLCYKNLFSLVFDIMIIVFLFGVSRGSMKHSTKLQAKTKNDERDQSKCKNPFTPFSALFFFFLFLNLFFTFVYLIFANKR